MKKLIILLIFSIFLIELLHAQDPDLEKYLRRREGIKYPNILKINSLAVPFNNISLAYERGLVPRFSFLIGAGYKYSGDAPKIFSTEDEIIKVKLNKIQGYSITPELRYYLKTCDSRFLDGFYLGVYFRHTHYYTNADLSFFPESHQIEFYTAKVVLNEYGAGLSIGYQLMLWERLSIDFMFFGPRYSNYHVGYEFNKNVSQEFLDELSGYINEVIDRFGFDYEVNLKQDGGGRASTSFSFANTRFGLSIGFAF